MCCKNKSYRCPWGTILGCNSSINGRIQGPF
ncbi:MAG TPA: hypothetical protein DEQ09_12250 [Bacteroidales bacterium]|nr:hypothetical protein [Bacteroidales bacterium]